MDRDAGSTFSLAPAEAVPPFSEKSVRITGLIGFGIIALATLLGLATLTMGESTPSGLNAVRVILVFIGVVTAGSAISMRPDLWWAWGIGTLSCLLAVFGLPNSWDSFQMFFTVVAGVAAAGVAFCRFSTHWRYVFATAI